MHYYALVKVDSTDNIGDQIEESMRPFREEHDEETDSLAGFWDWWSIGGRYTGRIDGYDPSTDRRNMKECWLCHGSGKRADEVGNQYRLAHPEYGCNGCDGTGIMLEHASSWAKHPGDIAARSVIADDAKPYTLIADGKAVHRETWDGEHFTNTQEALDEAWNALDPNALLVVVDYHC